MGFELLSTPIFQWLGMAGLGQTTRVSNTVLKTDARKGSTLEAFEKTKQHNPNGASERWHCGHTVQQFWAERAGRSTRSLALTQACGQG